MREDARADLRERLHSVAEHWWLSPSIPDEDNLGILANAMLAEIEAAGFALVEAERLARLRRASEMAELTWGDKAKLQPGDLEPHE